MIKQKHNRAQEHFISQNEYVFFFFFFLIAIQYISLSVIPISTQLPLECGQFNLNSHSWIKGNLLPNFVFLHNTECYSLLIWDWRVGPNQTNLVPDPVNLNDGPGCWSTNHYLLKAMH